MAQFFAVRGTTPNDETIFAIQFSNGMYGVSTAREFDKEVIWEDESDARYCLRLIIKSDREMKGKLKVVSIELQ